MSVQSIFNHSGGNGEGVPPVLIPNTEVKPFSASVTYAKYAPVALGLKKAKIPPLSDGYTKQ